MRNHQSRPTGSEPFPEVNVISSQTYGHGRERNFQYHGTHGSIQIPKNGKPHGTTISGIIPRLNKKMGSVTPQNPGVR